MTSHWSKADWGVGEGPTAPWQHIWKLRGPHGTLFIIKTRASFYAMQWVKLRQFLTLANTFLEQSIQSACKKKVPHCSECLIKNNLFSWKLEGESPCQALNQMAPLNQAIRAESDNWNSYLPNQQLFDSCITEAASLLWRAAWLSLPRVAFRERR